VVRFHRSGELVGDQVLRRRAVINAGSTARKAQSDQEWYKRTRSSPGGVEDVRDGGVQTTENVGVGREEAELDRWRMRGWPEQRQRDDVDQIMARTGLTASDTRI
jgi:hypothetical protein